MAKQNENAEVWAEYIPDSVYLYQISYDSTLRGSECLMAQCVQENDYCPLTEVIYDWWDYPEKFYLDDIQKAMIADGLEEEYDNNVNEIRETLWERDKSTPLQDLIGNTPDQTFFYSLGLELDHGWNTSPFMRPWYNQTYKQAAHRIRQALGIKKDTPEAEKILELCEYTNGGGELRIYFKDSIDNLISQNDDWDAIRFCGNFCIAVWNSSEGSGDFVFLDIDRNFQFVRENLQLSSEAEKWNIEDVCGLCGDWLDQCDKPTFSYSKEKLKKIKTSEKLKREAEYQKTYNAGGCTLSDDCISRHRDVYYVNEIPCGLRCPHCGKIWYD